MMDIISFGNPEAGTVLVQPVDEFELKNIENEVKYIAGEYGGDFCLVAVRVDDWNRDLSPWKTPAVFGKEEFGGEAGKTLEEILNICSDSSKTYFIGGYSLAGLFALWASYNTSAFSGVASASPSVWFPGFIEFIKARDIQVKNVYLSLGDKEDKTKNPVMATVGDRIRETHSILSECGVNCLLEWNQGNHFKDSDIRTAKAFLWVMERKWENI